MICPCCDATVLSSTLAATPALGGERERIAKTIYEVEPHHESGEYVDGFQVTPGGNLPWEQAKARDAEFGDDPLMGKITEFAYRCADALAAPTASPLWERGEQREQLYNIIGAKMLAVNVMANEAQTLAITDAILSASSLEQPAAPNKDPSK